MLKTNYKQLWRREKAKSTEYFNNWQQTTQYLQDAINQMKEHNKLIHPKVPKIILPK